MWFVVVQGNLVGLRVTSLHPTASQASSIADPRVGQVSGWVKERSFALGSVSYALGDVPCYVYISDSSYLEDTYVQKR